MRIIGIVQARMGSTRLPSKVMREVNGIPLLEYQINRMRKSKLLNELVIATTRINNKPIIELCKRLGVPFYRGSEEDVLERYYFAAKKYKADIVVRMTSDCPLIDPGIIDEIIQFYLDNDFDYVSNTQVRTFPRGMDTEVFSMRILEEAFHNAKRDYEREHVTPYLYLNEEIYKVGQYVDLKVDHSDIRLTVDTPEDFELITQIFEYLYQEDNFFNLNKILRLLEKHPELLEINKHIEQKKLGE